MADAQGAGARREPLRSNRVSEAKNVAVKAARVAAGDTRGHYDGFAVLLHWTTVVLVLVQCGLAQLWAFSPKPLRHQMIVAHMSFGVVRAAVIAEFEAWSKSAHLVLLASGHALAALAHHFWLGDDVLWRMLPGTARAR